MYNSQLIIQEDYYTVIFFIITSLKRIGCVAGHEIQSFFENSLTEMLEIEKEGVAMDMHALCCLKKKEKVT